MSDPAPVPAPVPHGSTPIVVVPFGPPALGALAGAVRAARRGDPLAPVTVVSGSAHVAVSVRRHLARLPHAHGRGLVGVRWLTPVRLAEELAGPALARERRPPLTDLLRRAAVRAALDEVPGRLAGLAPAAVERRVEATFEELRAAGADELARLTRRSAEAAELVAQYRAFRRHCRPFADRHEVVERAVAALRAGEPAAAAVGHVVLYLPEELDGGPRRLAGELARRGALTVVLARTGDARADAAVEELRDRLTAELAPAAVVAVGAAVERPPAPCFVRAPDAEEEVRVAVRRTLAALEAGTAPEDIAIVAMGAEPYPVLLDELLGAAGVPHHSAATTSLAQSVAGRALLGFLRLAGRGFPRAELFRWVRSAPVRTASGARVPSSYDRRARQAGVVGGVEQWHRRLDRLADERARRVGGGDDGEPDRVLTEVAGLRAFVDHLAGLAQPPAEVSWASTARWAGRVLERLVGRRAEVAAGPAAWPGAEVAAYDEVLAVLGDLAGLDAVEPGADRERMQRVLGQELARPGAGAAGGRGVFVGRLDELAGARHELMIVLGMADGRGPGAAGPGTGGPGAESLVSEADRRVVGGSLAARRRGDAAGHRHVLAALRAAPARQLSFARVDAALQRETLPSPVFLGELGAVLGRTPGVDELGGLDHPAFVDVPSFVAGAAGAAPALDAQERRVAGVLAGGETFPELAGGADAVRSRGARRFSRWTGDIGAFEALRFEGERVGSPTSFELWATCPFRYLLTHVLRVRAYDRHAEADSIDGRDRGSLVHEALERFVAEYLDGSPGRPPPDGAWAAREWTGEDRARLRAHAVDVAARYEGAGRTGRPLLWQAELDRLLRRLDRVLDADSAARARAGAHPVAVELAFGIDDAPPVALVTGAGRRVTFRGVIDRVDRDPVTGRLVVLDYKTGRDDGYGAIAQDITAGGRHLQLVVYAEAARRRFGGDDVEAYFWFVEMGRSTKRLGGVIGDAERARLGEVVDVIVDGIEQGRFPANPGEADFFGFEHCAYCEYERVCPSGRDDLWEGVRLSPRLDAYRRLDVGGPGGGR